jgi:hypothetical protein
MNRLLAIAIDDILRAQGTDPEVIRTRSPALVDIAGRALQAGQPYLHPQAVMSQHRILGLHHVGLQVEQGRLNSTLAACLLGNASHVVAVVCTIGADLEQLIARAMPTDVSLASALDGLANAAVEQLTEQICAHIAEQAADQGQQASTPFSPGAPDWPVDIGQPELFNLVDASSIGVRLLPTGLMSPLKSASFVVGLGGEMAHSHPCSLCTLRDRCHYHHD